MSDDINNGAHLEEYEHNIDALFGKIGETLKAQESANSNQLLDTGVKPRGRGRKKRLGKDIVNEALGANEGGDYASSEGTTDALAELEMQAQTNSRIVTYDRELAEALRTPPSPFIEPAVKTYNQDLVDALLPPPSFITDFVNVSRGMEAPTLFMYWGALWAISTILSRDAWLEWYPKPLWPNIYVLLVAPPGLCKKSTSLDIGQTLINEAIDLLPNNMDRFRKSGVVISGKATGDGILKALAPEDGMFFDTSNGENRMLRVDRGSKAFFAVSELTQLMNKSTYLASLTTTLTSLFDCRDEDSELTRGRGMEPLRKIYVTFMAATTPSNMRTSLPPEAMGGGFMSRIVTVFQDIPTKIYPIPRALPGYPTPDQLAPRLAWIAHHARGGYHLTEEAHELYAEQYAKWKERIFSSVVSEVSGETRYDIVLLKVAMLIRIAEYRKGNDITRRNVADAIAILDHTLKGSRSATEDIGLNDYARWMNQARRILERRESIDRATLQRSLSSKGCNVASFDMIIQQLAAEERIEIRYNGSVVLSPSRCGSEIYSLTPAEKTRLREEILDE